MKRKRYPKDRNYLQLAAERVEQTLPDNHAFILLTTPFNGVPETSRVAYVANCDRGDAINMLKEFLIRCGHEEDWMKHL